MMGWPPKTTVAHIICNLSGPGHVGGNKFGLWLEGTFWELIPLWDYLDYLKWVLARVSFSMLILGEEVAFENKPGGQETG